MSYYHPELPYIAFLAAVLVLVPLPWHWRAGNVATLAMIAWLFVINIIYGVDAAIWGHSIDTVIPVWCDITTKIIIGANIALPAACMCVCIHLEQVASMRQVRISAASKRRRQIIEGLLCYLVPMIWMGLHYIVQGHRFDIIEIYGCRPTTYVSIPAIFLIWVPPLILSTISMVYAALAFTHFMRRRISFAKHLQNSQSGLNTSRYLRLMMMAVIEMIIGVASTSVALAFSVEWDMRPWTNWSDVHWNFSRIDAYPILGTPQYVLSYDLAIWWITPVSSFIFFLFFAFGQEAMKEYGACARCIHICLFRIKGRTAANASIGKFVTLPSPRLDEKTAHVATGQDIDSKPSLAPSSARIDDRDFGTVSIIKCDCVNKVVQPCLSYHDDSSSESTTEGALSPINRLCTADHTIIDHEPPNNKD